MTAKRLQSGGAHGEAPVQKRPRWCCAEEAGPTPGAGADARKAVRDLQWACRQRPLDWWTAAAAAGVLGAGAAALTAKDAAVALQALAKVDDCDEARTAEALVRERLLQPASCDELDRRSRADGAEKAGGNSRYRHRGSVVAAGYGPAPGRIRGLPS
ncbi:unnamed protein product [Prorocentrum cordatum]|uniref:Uncharacterized protein n=1 Tax=Prorocentrum cordatum TaxID=2364126 RepID=A0ABN9WPL6_9DINO|nr:unnamed protein product [Polarella glacialis]